MVMSDLCAGFRSTEQQPFVMGARMRQGDEALLAMKFNRIIGRLEDPTPAYRYIITQYRDSIEKLFDSEGADAGGWVGLAVSTAKQRARKGYGAYHPILVRSGDLRDSLIDANNRLACEMVSPRAWYIGTQVYYAVYHQSLAPRTKLPRRPMMIITNQFRLRIIRTLHWYMIHGDVGGW